MLADQYKVHETDQDRNRQEEILEAWCEGMNMHYGVTKAFDQVDGLISRDGKLQAVAEVKYRSVPFGKYPDYTIDRSKINALIDYARKLNIKPILIVGFYTSDYPGIMEQNAMDIRWTVVHEGYPTSIQKRIDRDEKPDLVCHIPWEEFR